MDKNKMKKIEIKFSQYLLLIFFLSLLTIFLIVGFNKLINKDIVELQQKKEQKTALGERISNLNKLDKEYQAISADVKMINNLLPQQDKLIDTITKIEKMAEENHLELSLKLSEPAGHKLPTKFKIKGYFNDLMNFYKKISSGEVLVYIKAVDISDANNMLDNAQAEIEGEVYFD